MINSELHQGQKVKLNKYHGFPAYSELVEVGAIGTVYQVWTSGYALVIFPRAMMGIFMDDLDYLEGDE